MLERGNQMVLGAWVMGSEWEEITLGEFVTLQRGHDLPKQKRISGTIPILGSFGITGWHNKSKVNGPGVTIGRSGASYGVVTFSDVDFWPLNTALFVKDFHGNDPLFASYFLKSMDFKGYNSGSAVQSLNRNHIHPIKIKIHHLPEQKAIAHILGSLDDKIELNRQINKTLEAMAQALFKSWFVDFDPVIDNALAAGNAIPESLQMRAAQRQENLNQQDAKQQKLRKHFPSEFEFNESLGWVPKGWEVAKLQKLLTVKYGKDHKKLDEGKIPVYGSGGLMRKVDKSLYKGESILIPRKGTLSNLMYVDEDFWTVDTMFFSIPQLKNSAKYLFYNLNRLDFSSMNVGSAVPSMTTKVLNNLDILKPTSGILKKFDGLLADSFCKRKALNNEADTLTKLRDTLLPKLLSGELRIPDAEKLVEEI